MGYVQKKGLDLLWAKSKRRTDNKISYQCGTLKRNSIISVALTDNRFYDSLESYVDDVLGHTENWSKHMEILQDFFQRVRKANLCLRPSKWKIGFDPGGQISESHTARRLHKTSR